MKRIYLTLGVLAAFTTGVFAQTDLSLEPFEPYTNQQYPNFAPGDTMTAWVIVKNNGPDNLLANDSVKVQMSLDWLIAPQGYVFRNTYGGSDLPNAMTAGGSDTVGFSYIQGSNVGSTPDGDAIIMIPTDATTDGIIFKTYGFTYTPSYDILDDVGVSLDSNNDLVIDGNNVLNPTNVKFGTPAGIKVIKDNSALTVYPNPVVNTANISYNVKSSSNVTASITDISGRIIMTKDFGTANVGTQTFSMDVSALNSGVYMLEINADNNRATSKFTVK